MKRSIFFIAVIFTSIGCATTTLPEVSNNDFSIQDDERRLWLRVEEEEKAILESGLVYNDVRLTSYLNNIARKIAGEDVNRKIPIRVVIIKNSYCNAFAYPNGYIFVHTGILSRIENEAQLATLLGHEITHITHRHAIKDRRSLKNKSAIIASLGVSIGTLPLVGELFHVMGEIGARAAVSGYSKDLEREADANGFLLVKKAGYRMSESPKLFKHLLAEMESEKIEEPLFFGTHPRLKERMSNFNEFLLKEKGDHDKGIVNKEIYETMIGRLLLDNAVFDIQLGRFETALNAVNRYIALHPSDPAVYCVAGRIFMERNDKGDEKKAFESFEKALALNGQYADAHKGIGMIKFKQGDKIEARRYFANYLRLSPKADDSEFIRQYLEQCN